MLRLHSKYNKNIMKTLYSLFYVAEMISFPTNHESCRLFTITVIKIMFIMFRLSVSKIIYEGIKTGIWLF